jgi:methionyl-tRNA formyltransferase
MGSCEFSLRVLAMVHASFPCQLVITAPPKPRGRGHQVRPTCVQDFAQQAGIEVRTPLTLRCPQVQAGLRDLALDVVVVASYGLLLPQEVLTIPAKGCLNVHPSLLPRWRGASPVASAIAAGDTHTGVCLMVMDQGLDTGNVVWCQTLAIDPALRTDELSAVLADMGGEALSSLLPAYVQGHLHPTAQSCDGIKMAPKITKAMAYLDPQHDGHTLARWVRAYTPKPGAWMVFLPHQRRMRVGPTIIDQETLTACAPDGELAPNTQDLLKTPPHQKTKPEITLTVIQAQGLAPGWHHQAGVTCLSRPDLLGHNQHASPSDSPTIGPETSSPKTSATEAISPETCAPKNSEAVPALDIGALFALRDGQVGVVCADGSGLLLTQVRSPSGKTMAMADFLRGSSCPAL